MNLRSIMCVAACLWAAATMAQKVQQSSVCNADGTVTTGTYNGNTENSGNSGSSETPETPEDPDNSGGSAGFETGN